MQKSFESYQYPKSCHTVMYCHFLCFEFSVTHFLPWNAHRNITSKINSVDSDFCMQEWCYGRARGVYSPRRNMRSSSQFWKWGFLGQDAYQIGSNRNLILKQMCFLLSLNFPNFSRHLCWWYLQLFLTFPGIDCPKWGCLVFFTFAYLNFNIWNVKMT